MGSKLYIVATPIGNLEDITLRALRVLREADAVAAEDTRVTGKLLARYEIKKQMIALHQHNELSKAQVLIERLKQGENIALCTDAGTPAVSDPGALLVRAVRAEGIECVPIPGASAVVSALSVSGMDTARFVFEGFLPASGRERRERIEQLAQETRAIVLYEAPHRLHKTLADLAVALGEREITIARELTKLHEQVETLPLSQAAEMFGEPRGEFVLILQGNTQEQQPDYEQAEARMQELLAQGVKRKQAAAQVAEAFGVSKNEAYEMGL